MCPEAAPTITKPDSVGMLTIINFKTDVVMVILTVIIYERLGIPFPRRPRLIALL
jgi:hypothetical protein